MSQQSEQLKDRTITFAIEALRLIERFPTSVSARVVANQLAKCATSVAANYRAACNARSRQEFVARLGVVVEEADESSYWLELIARSGLHPAERLVSLTREAGELRAIFAKSLGTARSNLHRRSVSPPIGK